MRARAHATYAQAGVCGREGRGIRACKAGVARLVMRPLDRQKEEPHWDIFSCLGGRLRQQQVIHPSVCGPPSRSSADARHIHPWTERIFGRGIVSHVPPPRLLLLLLLLS